MAPVDDSNLYVWDGGYYGILNRHYIYCDYMVVRPVIVLSKSVL